MWTDPNSTDAVQARPRLTLADFAFLKQGSWIALTLLVVVLVPTFWQLSDWQFHRFESRRDSNTAVLAASKQEPVALGIALSKSGGFVDWTPVFVTGRWAAGTAMARKHWRDGVMGFWAVSRLHTAQGSFVTVRGWLPTTQSAKATPRDPGLPFSDEVVISGWLVSPEAGKTPQGMPRGQITRVNAMSVTGAIARPSVSLRSDAMLVIDHARTPRSSYALSSGLYDITPPDLGDGPHHAYAWQWRAFIVLILAGWARLVVAQARDEQQRERESV